VQCPVDRGLTCLGGTAFEVSEGYWLADDAAACTSGQCILERVYECGAEQACSSGGAARNVTEFAQVPQLQLCAEGHRSDIVQCARWVLHSAAKSWRTKETSRLNDTRQRL
jgi:hypothetical protein